MLTLEECRKRPITDLVMAEFVTCFTTEETYDNIRKTFSESEANEMISGLNRYFYELFDEINEENVDISDTEKDELISSFKKNERIFKKRFATIVLKVSENEYQNLSKDYIDLSRCELVHTEPFSDYYNEGDYNFDLHDGRVVIDLNSTEPFEYFERKNR